MTATNVTKTAKQIACANCGEPTTAKKRIPADHKIYCTKLCAGLGLMQTACDEDDIDPDTAIDTLTMLVQRSLCEDPVPIPTRVRACDSYAFIDAFIELPRGNGDRRFIVVISDDGTPDWVPELTSENAQKTAAENEAPEDPSQAEIDQVVEDLLRNGPEAEDLP